MDCIQGVNKVFLIAKTSKIFKNITFGINNLKKVFLNYDEMILKILQLLLKKYLFNNKQNKTPNRITKNKNKIYFVYYSKTKTFLTCQK